MSTSSPPVHYLTTERRRRTRTTPLRRLLFWLTGIFIILLIVFWPSSSHTSILPSGTHNRQRPLDKSDVELKPERGSNRPNLNPNYAKIKAPSLPKQHRYRPDGLLEVNPRGRHPIYELIETAEIQWKRKLRKQSKTFDQAVKEYKRRYKRPPPKGFELWWDYADYYGVQLRDEYDSIHKHLQALWGVNPAVLQRLQREAESQYDSFTIGKLPGSDKVELLNDTLGDRSGYKQSGHSRLKDILDMLDEIQEWLPEFRATFSMHDSPRVQISWEARHAAEKAAERGEYIDTSKIQSSARGWSAVCPPSSALRAFVLPRPGTDTSTQEVLSSLQATNSDGKTFIYNHALAMSPCDHPSLVILNGMLSSFHYETQLGPTEWPEFTPIFSMSSTPLNFDILHPAAESWMGAEGIARDAGGKDQVLKWDDMYDERLLWRGSTTGTSHSQETPWWNVSQRIRLVEMATRRGGETRVLLSPFSDRDDAVGFGRTLKYSTLNNAFMDVAFSGVPQQCDKETCAILSKMFEFRRPMTFKEAGGYKYIMDIDGNGWSSRFKRLISSNSLIFKATVFPEWYTERIMPWVHYVPVQYTLADLYDILAFFRGSPFSNLADAELEDIGVEGMDSLDSEREFRGNDRLAQKIASAGRDWSETMFRKEDMVAYMYRLLLEYARVMALDRESMTMKA